MNKKLSFFFLSAITSSLIAAEPVKVKDELSYDASSGWWWYTETYKDPASKKEEQIKFKMSPEEKNKLDREKDTQKLLKSLVEKQDEGNKINQSILERLNYAYPDVAPIYTVNAKTGKKCLTNSSADCFVLPVQAEGQQVPVLKEFLREPSPSKSKEWLKWQGTYFNHINKISHGLRFAYLKDGADAYPTATNFALGDNPGFSEAEDVQAVKEAKVLQKNKDKIAYVIFLGQNMFFENLTNVYYQFDSYNKTFMKDMKYAIVFPSEQAKKEAMDYVQNLVKTKGEKNIGLFFKTAKTSVRPDLYEKYNIRMTPSVVMFYEDKKANKNIWQTISTGLASVNSIRRGSINFLTYNGIVQEKEFGADRNWATMNETVVKKPIEEANLNDVFDDYTTDEENGQ